MIRRGPRPLVFSGTRLYPPALPPLPSGAGHNRSTSNPLLRGQLWWDWVNGLGVGPGLKFAAEASNAEGSARTPPSPRIQLRRGRSCFCTNV